VSPYTSLFRSPAVCPVCLRLRIARRTALGSFIGLASFMGASVSKIGGNRKVYGHKARLRARGRHPGGAAALPRRPLDRRGGLSRAPARRGLRRGPRGGHHQRPCLRGGVLQVYRLIPEVKEFGPRKGSQLSGGQQKLAALGRSLMCGTKLLLLDEPFEGVAPALAQRLVEVVANLKKEGMSVILSESDLQHSERMVDRLFVLDRGSLSTRN